MIIKESAENYLEAIYVIKNKKGSVRSIDVANELGFSKASVSVAMKNFREAGYIKMDENGELSLTKKGVKIAEGVFKRHELIAEILIKLGVNKETAFEDSCKIEHSLSEESFIKIKEFFENYNKGL